MLGRPGAQFRPEGFPKGVSTSITSLVFYRRGLNFILTWRSIVSNWTSRKQPKKNHKRAVALAFAIGLWPLAAHAACTDAPRGAVDWNGCDKQRLMLGKVNLTGLRAVGTDLGGTDLANANLSGADLSRASLERVRLNGADLSGAKLVDASIYRADMMGAKLVGADLTKAEL